MTKEKPKVLTSADTGPDAAPASSPSPSSSPVAVRPEGAGGPRVTGHARSTRAWNRDVATREHCPKSVTSHAQNDRSGRCAWCGYQVDPPVPMPRLDGWRTELDLAYRRTYDPNWGTDPRDYDV